MSDALATSSQLLSGRTLRRGGMSDALATGSQLLSGRNLRRDLRRAAILRAMSLRGWPRVRLDGMSDVFAASDPLLPLQACRLRLSRPDEIQTNKISTTVHMTRQLHSTVTRKHSCNKKHESAQHKTAAFHVHKTAQRNASSLLFFQSD